MFDFIRRPFLRRFGRDSVYYKIIDDVFGICPDNIELYKLALVHKSASLFLDDGRQINNERLEFLGDAVIETVVSDYIFIEYPEADEGFLTKLRSKIVSRQSLNGLAVKIGLDKHVIAQSSGTLAQKHIFGDALEAMTALTFVLPKSLPLIYTGQEIGYDHSFAFFDKDAMPKFEENEASKRYRRLCEMKHSFSALRSADEGGSFVEINNNAPDCMLTFVRENEEGRVVYVGNLSPYKIFADFHTGIYAGEYENVLTGEKEMLYEHTWGDMEPWSFRLLTQKL